MEQNRFRCHISIVLQQLLPMAVLFVVLAADNIDEVLRYMEEGTWTADKSIGTACGILVLILMYTGYALVLWAKTWIRIDGKSLVIERNTMFRKVQTIGLENVSNVNLTQNLLQRFLHVYAVKLDTNSVTTAEESDVHIALKEDKAVWLRECDTGSSDNTGHEEEIVRKKNSILHYSFGSLLFRWFFMCNVLGMLIVALLPLVTLYTERKSILTAAILWIGVVVNLIGGLFRYYDFRADRRGNEIKVSYGFFNRREYRIPVDKISAIRIRQETACQMGGTKNNRINLYRFRRR